jgi:hypothetical protein
MELQILSDTDTVEPSSPTPMVVAPRRRDPVGERPSLSARLQATAPGRFTLSCLQWSVVLGLVLSGYVGAEIINTGMQRALGHSPSTAGAAAPMLAASAHD